MLLSDGPKNWTGDLLTIHSAAIDHFEKHLTLESINMDEDILEVIPSKLSILYNTSLMQPTTTDEVLKAVFNMRPDSALALDRLTCFCYKHCRNIVG